MSSSDLSELTSNVSSEDEQEQRLSDKNGTGKTEKSKKGNDKGKLDHYFSHANGVATIPPTLKKKRAASPPYEYGVIDNADIAFICMFRSRFDAAFPKSLPHLGPQDIEGGVVGEEAGECVERLLCALLGLVLNRKKDVEKGHYTRALEEALSANIHQWPASWAFRNPLHGGGTFNTMTPDRKLELMKTLVFWSLESSDTVREMIKESYKQTRHDDDLNQPLSVQSWGSDGDKRRFWLIEGRDDTHFRLYRESNPVLQTVTWRNLAGTIEELRTEAEKLGQEGTQKATRLHDRILASIPRFEASEEKRRRRDYRLARRAQFIRPEIGFSSYEGRTRGKRVRYNYSDEENDDEFGSRRSTRNSGISTPLEVVGPTYTASGRQVRPRNAGTYGEIVLNNGNSGEETQFDRSNGTDDSSGRDVEESKTMGIDGEHQYPDQRRDRENGYRSRARLRNKLADSDEEMMSEASSSGNEWQGGGGDDDEEEDEDEELNAAEDEEELDERHDAEDRHDHLRSQSSSVHGDENGSLGGRSLVVRLSYGKGVDTTSDTNAAVDVVGADSLDGPIAGDQIQNPDPTGQEEDLAQAQKPSLLPASTTTTGLLEITIRDGSDVKCRTNEYDTVTA